MTVQFTITMDDLVVDGAYIDQLIIQWKMDMDQTEVLHVSHEWINTNNYLTSHMVGLQRVGESSLEIEPL